MNAQPSRAAVVAVIRLTAAAALPLIGLIVLASTTVGCRRASDEMALSAVRSAAPFLLDEEPAGAQSVVQIREVLASGERSDQVIAIVLAARVGGLDGVTWDPNRASFVVRDPPDADEDESEKTPHHDDDNCPFCRARRKKALASTALVQLVDEQNEVPPMDARKLLNLEEGQMIVVRGRARLDGLGNLTVQAEKIYIRQDAAKRAS